VGAGPARAPPGTHPLLPLPVSNPPAAAGREEFPRLLPSEPWGGVDGMGTGWMGWYGQDVQDEMGMGWTGSEDWDGMGWIGSMRWGWEG